MASLVFAFQAMKLVSHLALEILTILMNHFGHFICFICVSLSFFNINYLAMVAHVGLNPDI
jgi:hypothetical protein